MIVRKINTMYKVLFCSYLFWGVQIGSSLGSNEANQPLPIVMWHGMGKLIDLIFNQLQFSLSNFFFVSFFL